MDKKCKHNKYINELEEFIHNNTSPQPSTDKVTEDFYKDLSVIIQNMSPDEFYKSEFDFLPDGIAQKLQNIKKIKNITKDQLKFIYIDPNNVDSIDFFFMSLNDIQLKEYNDAMNNTQDIFTKDELNAGFKQLNVAKEWGLYKNYYDMKQRINFMYNLLNKCVIGTQNSEDMFMLKTYFEYVATHLDKSNEKSIKALKIRDMFFNKKVYKNLLKSVTGDVLVDAMLYVILNGINVAKELNENKDYIAKLEKCFYDNFTILFNSITPSEFYDLDFNLPCISLDVQNIINKLQKVKNISLQQLRSLQIGPDIESLFPFLLTLNNDQFVELRKQLNNFDEIFQKFLNTIKPKEFNSLNCDFSFVPNDIKNALIILKKSGNITQEQLGLINIGNGTKSLFQLLSTLNEDQFTALYQQQEGFNEILQEFLRTITPAVELNYDKKNYIRKNKTIEIITQLILGDTQIKSNSTLLSTLFMKLDSEQFAKLSDDDKNKFYKNFEILLHEVSPEEFNALNYDFSLLPKYIGGILGKLTEMKNITQEQLASIKIDNKIESLFPLLLTLNNDQFAALYQQQERFDEILQEFLHTLTREEFYSLDCDFLFLSENEGYGNYISESKKDRYIPINYLQNIQIKPNPKLLLKSFVELDDKQFAILKDNDKDKFYKDFEIFLNAMNPEQFNSLSYNFSFLPKDTGDILCELAKMKNITQKQLASIKIDNKIESLFPLLLTLNNDQFNELYQLETFRGIFKTFINEMRVDQFYDLKCDFEFFPPDTKSVINALKEIKNIKDEQLQLVDPQNESLLLEGLTGKSSSQLSREQLKALSSPQFANLELSKVIKKSINSFVFEKEKFDKQFEPSKQYIQYLPKELQKLINDIYDIVLPPRRIEDLRVFFLNITYLPKKRDLEEMLLQELLKGQIDSISQAGQQKESHHQAESVNFDDSTKIPKKFGDDDKEDIINDESNDDILKEFNDDDKSQPNISDEEQKIWNMIVNNQHQQQQNTVMQKNNIQLQSPNSDQRFLDTASLIEKSSHEQKQFSLHMFISMWWVFSAYLNVCLNTLVQSLFILKISRIYAKNHTQLHSLPIDINEDVAREDATRMSDEIYGNVARCLICLCESEVYSQETLKIHGQDIQKFLNDFVQACGCGDRDQIISFMRNPLLVDKNSPKKQCFVDKITNAFIRNNNPLIPIKGCNAQGLDVITKGIREVMSKCLQNVSCKNAQDQESDYKFNQTNKFSNMIFTQDDKNVNKQK